MAGTAWMKFYPSDWRSDPALRMCSIGARGLWMEMLCIMHEAAPSGSLLVNGRPVSSQQLAGLAGIAPREAGRLLGELEAAGVFSREEDGVIYSRRIRRDAEKAERDKANGKAGGNPILKPQDNGGHGGGLTPGVKAQKPEARSQKEDISSAPPPDDPWLRFKLAYPRRAGEQDWKTAKTKFDRHVKEGVDPETVIAGAKAYAAKMGELGNIGTAYVKQAATWLNKEIWREYPTIAASANGSAGKIYDEADPHTWELRLSVGRERLMWPRPKWGPMPGEDGCRCPPEMIQPTDGRGWAEWGEAH